MTKDNFSNSESGCLLGKAGRARYYTAYEEASESLRGAINQEVDQFADTIIILPMRERLDEEAAAGV